MTLSIERADRRMAWLLIGPCTRRSEIDHCCFTDAFLMIRARVTSNPEVETNGHVGYHDLARKGGILTNGERRFSISG
jgi:hypothetical protein